jgi:hypothetical protein
MKRALAAAAAFAAALALAACGGVVPPSNAPPEEAISAILIGGRMILPSGQVLDGETNIGFESGGDRNAQVYRLPVKAGRNELYLVEPGLYRFAPTRTILGQYRTTLTAVIEGRRYTIPFPRELMSYDSFNVKPSRILALGVLEIRVMPALPGRAPEVRVRLDDSIAARRALVQDTIRDMMDPTKPPETRDAAVAWNQALQKSLLSILAEQQKQALYTPAP